MKILITTTLNTYHGVSVHTSLVEFGSQEEADNAAMKINNQSSLPDNCRQWALRMF